jgi:hypothetical protein
MAVGLAQRDEWISKKTHASGIAIDPERDCVVLDQSHRVEIR